MNDLKQQPLANNGLIQGSDKSYTSPEGGGEGRLKGCPVPPKTFFKGHLNPSIECQSKFLCSSLLSDNLRLRDGHDLRRRGAVRAAVLGYQE